MRGSAVSRAILKPVYWFGIPNSNPQMLKSVDFWWKLWSMYLVTEPREWCFELFRTQNSQKFPRFCPWTPLGRAYSTAPDSPVAQRFFSLLCSLKNQHPKKIAGYGTVWLMNFFIWGKNVSFSRYLDFSAFVKSTDFKICDVIIGIAA